MLVFGLVCAAGAAEAQTRPPCVSVNAPSATIAKPIDGRSLALEDGRVIRLALLDPAADKVAKAGRDRLADLAGRTVTLDIAASAPDRYGRIVAIVGIGNGETVQGLLMSEGLARLAPETTPSVSAACVSALKSLENSARQREAGLWRNTGEIAPFAIKNAESRDEMVAASGTFALVDGTVLTVRKTGSVTYLNFARAAARGFAAAVPERKVAEVETAGMRLDALRGRRVRVRGWIEVGQGPRITIVGPDQIEVLDTVRATR